MHNSISKIEEQLKAHRDKGDKSKAAKSEYQRLKQNLNRVYADSKKFILDFEQTNYKYLALIRSTHGFFKLFDHSALFYAHHVAPKLNLKVNLRPDGDFAHKSAIGFVSIREPAKFAEALKPLDIIQLCTKDQTGNFLLFRFPWEFTDDQLAEMIEDHHFKLQKFNHIVMTDNIIPVLYLQIGELLNAVYENVRNMPSQVEREAFGYDLIKTITIMQTTYFDMTNGFVSKHAGLKTIKQNLTRAKYRIKIIAELKIWQPKTTARITDIAIRVQDVVDRELRMEK